jgi:DNA-binding NtrC family response regulator
VPLITGQAPVQVVNMALEKAGGRIDLVICDVVMPGMSGPEVVDRLRARSPAIRAILMSGYTDNVVVRHGILEGEYDFLEKPFSTDRLAAKIRGALTSFAAGHTPLGPPASPPAF